MTPSDIASAVDVVMTTFQRDSAHQASEALKARGVPDDPALLFLLTKDVIGLAQREVIGRFMRQAEIRKALRVKA